jgi:hypothetical protein
MNPKIEWQWPAVIVFIVALLVAGGLVFTGKMHAEVLLAFFAWLMPGPWQQRPTTPPTPTTTLTVTPAPPSEIPPVTATVVTSTEPKKDEAT